MEKQRPVINNRDRNLSISIFKKDQTDNEGHLRTYYSACLQRSYKTKDSGEWKREQINLYPDELLALQALTLRTHNDLTLFVQKEKSSQNTRESYPAQSFDVPDAPAADLDDDIPF